MKRRRLSWITRPTTPAPWSSDPRGKLLLPLPASNPTGGEAFVVGSDTVVTWEGIPPDQNFRIEYSTDAGKTWHRVQDTTIGNTYQWKVPNTPSDQCLARVTHLQDEFGAKELWRKKPLNMGWIEYAEFSKDGKYVLTQGYEDPRIVIWDAMNGSKVQTIETFSWVNGQTKFSNDASKIAVRDYPWLKLFNTNDGTGQSQSRHYN